MVVDLPTLPALVVDLLALLLVVVVVDPLPCLLAILIG